MAGLKQDTTGSLINVLMIAGHSVTPPNVTEQLNQSRSIKVGGLL